MEKEEFIRLLPKLIREDDEIKGAIITALSGVVATKNDIKLVIEESNKRFEELINTIKVGFEEARSEREGLRVQISTIGTRTKKL